MAAWRGCAETADGAPLTSVQLNSLAPFLAQRLNIAEAIVRGDLSRVRVLTGGPAAGTRNMATTIGTNIYVSDAACAVTMLSWDGRLWLAHELTHTMQWRRAALDATTDAKRDRAFLNQYVGKFVSDDGSIGKGGLATAFKAWLQSRREPRNPVTIGDLIHDSHPLEREAAQVALAFGAVTN